MEQANGLAFDKPELGEFAWRKAVALAPGNVQYRINLVKLLVAMGKDQEARAQIEAIRRMGIPGQYEKAARGLESSMRRQP